MSLLPHALLLLVLIPCIGLAAWLLSALHSQERAALETATRARATLAASSLDQEMLGLIRVLQALPPVPLTTAAEDRNIVYARARYALAKTGIVFCARSPTLEPLLSAEPNGRTFAMPEGAAREAALAALSTNEPQVTPFSSEADETGIDLWLASATNGSSSTLLQARVPMSFLEDILKAFTKDDTWAMAITGSDGGVLATIGALSSPTGTKTEHISHDFEAFADTSQFGWRLRATMPLSGLTTTERRNWIGFLVVTCLLTLASLFAATRFSRKVFEQNHDSLSAPRPFSDEAASARRESGTVMLMSPALGPYHTFDPDQPDAPKVAKRLRIALGAGGMGAWKWAARGRIIEGDLTLSDILRTATYRPALTAKEILRRIEPQDRRRLLQAVSNTLSTAQPLAAEFRITRFDGERRWFSVRGTPTTNEAGRITDITGIAHDITDKKETSSRTDTLLREISHRSKNMLALILAMARLTAREAVDVKSHLKDFTLRVAGLAASQDLIVAADWQSVDLGALAFAEVEAVARSDAARVTITGPSFLLTPEAAQTLGMIVTELTLNAVEHGALSVAGGAVRLSWQFPDEETITISWHETGGPGFNPKLPKGYGLAVVERFSTQGLKVNAHIAEDADGFVWVLNGPIENIGKRPPPHRA